MSILTVELPDAVMENLERAAHARGQAVETFVRDWAQEVSAAPVHPLMKLAGITNSNTPDLATNHDYYLVEEMMNTHADEK